jgi:glycosyltransferase involved in cell wall biosynthesis
VRVLVVTVVHDPEDARIRHRQIEALRAAGHDVVFAAPFASFGREHPAGMECIDVPRAHGLRRVAAGRAARRLLRERGRTFDIVLLHDPELLAAAYSTSLPGLVWDVHEDTAASIEMKAWIPRPARPAARSLVRMLERAAERRARLLLAEESYNRLFRRSHPVVANSVLTPRGDLPLPADDRVVYLGRITMPRGTQEMIELGRHLAPEVHVELIGNADTESLAAVEVAHRAGEVRWRGFVPNDQALPMLCGAMAGLSLLHNQPNYAHSRPTKIMEYMAHGVPVITTPNPSSAELVEKHQCGLVVPFADTAAAEAAVSRLRHDVALRHRFAKNGREAAARHYSWDNDADHFVHLLEGWASPRL